MEECAAACRKGVKQNVRKSIECKVTPRKEDVIDICGCCQRTAVCLQSDVSTWRCSHSVTEKYRHSPSSSSYCCK